VRRFLPFLLLAILLVGVGFGVDLGLSEAPSGSHLGLAMPSVHPAPVSTGSSTTSTTSLVVAAPKPGDPGWPITVYEPAVPSKGGALAQCPNPLGLESFGPSQESAAQQIATSYDHISLDTDLHNSDPSSWIAVRAHVAGRSWPWSNEPLRSRRKVRTQRPLPLHRALRVWRYHRRRDLLSNRGAISQSRLCRVPHDHLVRRSSRSTPHLLRLLSQGRCPRGEVG